MNLEVPPTPQTTLVILLGASTWPRWPDLGASEAFANSAQGVRNYFLDPQKFHLPQENLLDLFDSDQSADDIDDAINQFLHSRIKEMKEHNQAARDVLVYFIGHAGFAEGSWDYYLAIRRTRKSNPETSGLRIVSLAKTVKENTRHRRLILILDCCYAAAAFNAFQSQGVGLEEAAITQTVDAFRSPRPRISAQRIDWPRKGIALLCSSSRSKPSFLGQQSTEFSGALLHILDTGSADELGNMSLRMVADLVRDFLDEIGSEAPRPEVHSPDQGEGDVAVVPFFPNPGAQEERMCQVEEERRHQAEEAERARRMEEERQRRGEEERIRQAEEERDRKAREKQSRPIEEERRYQAEVERQTAFPSQGRQTHPPSQPPLPATMSSPHQDLLIASVRTASRSGGPVTPRSRRRQFPERMRLLSILAVVLLLISGGGMWGVITYGQRQAARVAHSPVQTTSSATITATPTSYNTAAVRYGVQKGFDAQHTNYNPYEHQLSPSTVSRLMKAWTASVGNNPSSPIVIDGVIYIVSEDGKLYAFKADGCGKPTCSPLWTAQTGDTLNVTTPAVVGGIVYVGSYDYKLYAFKADGCGKPTCLPLWTAQIGQGTDDEFGPVVASNIVYVRSAASQTFYAFRADGCGEPTCSPLWTAHVGLDAFVGSLAVAGGIVYIGSSDHTLYTFRADGCGQPDCLPLWTARASNGAFHGSPAVAGGIVYIGSSDHTLYTFRADGCGKPICLPLWTAQTSAEIYSAPAVANGVVYIGSVDGQLSVFHL